MNKSVIFALTFILLSSFALAQEFPNYKNKYVNDFANILSPDQVLELGSLFSRIDQDTTAEVVFVSVNSSQPYSPQEYRTRLFNEWKIGKSDKDNGLLIIYFLQEKRIEVEAGYGLEGILPDSKLGRLLDTYYVPSRNSGNTTEGIIQFSQAVSQEIYNNKEEVLAGNSNNNKASDLFTLVIQILIFLAILGSIIYIFTKRKKKGVGDFFYFVIIDFIIRTILISTLLRGGGRSGGGGGFGGGGFGGGGSGGGGAGR